MQREDIKDVERGDWAMKSWDTEEARGKRCLGNKAGWSQKQDDRQEQERRMDEWSEWHTHRARVVVH